VDRRGLRRVARESLGLGTWLPGQEDALRALAEGRDTLALLPTGGGKSAIYQLAGVIRPGPTVVVSPLIALQQDQLRSPLEAFRRDELEFLLLGPEQLARDDVLDALSAGRPSLFVVDEAHCVSEWGPDFRPEYRRLGTVAERIGRPPILALTATASPAVREEIARWLGLDDPAIISRGFDRPNLTLQVTFHPDAEAKRRALLDWVLGTDPPGIVYTATRAAAVELAARLRTAGMAAEPYHAGLGRRRRQDVQDAFIGGDLPIVVATIAFGMGIDKPDVRFVGHLDISDSLDAYYQEIGRAGRDGGAAVARLFYRPEDLGLRRFQGAPAVLDTADARAVLRAVRGGPTDVPGLAARARRSRRRTEAVVTQLERLDAAVVDPSGVVRIRDDGLQSGMTALAVRVVDEQERARRLAASRVEMLRGYAETTGCRRRFLLNYLGEEYEPPCGACDRCLATSETSGGGAPRPDDRIDRGTGSFRLNDPVVHARFGPGLVSRVEGDRITVRFEDVGYRTLSLPEVEGRGVLVRADVDPSVDDP
jgi:ATP-dependent DNA helicase RecQ